MAGFLTKKPGICLTVSAPGFLNGLAALANATTNCFPMMQISGSSERDIVDLQTRRLRGDGPAGGGKPYAKAAYRVDRAEDIGIGVARAIRAAVSGRPGGVYLDIPAKVLGEVIDADKGTAVAGAGGRPRPAPTARRRNRSTARSHCWQVRERPLIVLGKGAAYAQADSQIRTFVESSGMPYLPMSMAKGLLPDDHPQSVAAARSWHAGSRRRRAGRRAAELAARPWQGPQWSPEAKFIQVDIRRPKSTATWPLPHR